MARKVYSTFIPKFAPNNLPWYERDGLNTCYEQNKCNDFLEDPSMNTLQLIQEMWIKVVLLRKSKIATIKKLGRTVFVICHCLLLVDFLVFFFIIM